MNTVVLKRFGSIPTLGTFGSLKTDGFSCLTVEREWLNNEPEISCIPLGQYICALVDSPHFGSVYEVQNVTGRSHILIHPANVQSELKGCIALGNKYGWLKDQLAVLNSRATLETFMHLMNADEFLLVIENGSV